MNYETIKNRYTGEVMCGGLSLKEVFERHKKWLRGEVGGERADLRDSDLSGADLRDSYLSRTNLRGAALSGADLSGADLRRANLRRANLGGANLSGADLRDANLSEANLSEANLSGAILSDVDLSDADLSRADLSDAVLIYTNLRNSDLSRTNLSGANLNGSNLSGTNLSGANLRDCPVTIPNIHSRVYESASQPGCLNMRTWHTCETTHCRAGWVITLAGDMGRALEWAMGTPAAAAMIYMASDPWLEKIPDFYCSNAEALADMKRLAELEAAKKNPNSGTIAPLLNPQPGAGYD